MTIQDIAEIRAEVCNADDFDDQDGNTIADRWAGQIGSQWTTIKAEGERIQRSADDLIAKGRAKTAAPQTKQAVDAILAGLTSYIEGRVRGSNDPTVKALIEYGVAEHNRRQSGCAGRELTIDSAYCTNPKRNPKPDGVGCRLDCVRGCDIVEIKPASAEDLGQEQADKYVKGLVGMYATEKEKMFERSGFGIFRACVKEGRLDLRTKIELYNFCDQTSSLAPPPAVLSVDVPNEAE